MRLADLFVDLMAYALSLKRSSAAAALPYERVRDEVLRLLGRCDSAAKEGPGAPEDYDAARFAVCAFVDEAILDSSWAGKNLWQRELLQRTFYRTTEAGVEFFERLNALGPLQHEVREVYDLCLALGFLGRFCHKEDQHLLEQLKEANLKILLDSPKGLPSLRWLEDTDLFPGGRVSGSPVADSNERKFVWSFLPVFLLVGPVALFGILLFIYRQVLGTVGLTFLTSLP